MRSSLEELGQVNGILDKSGGCSKSIINKRKNGKSENTKKAGKKNNKYEKSSSTRVKEKKKKTKKKIQHANIINPNRDEPKVQAGQISLCES